jgi:acetyltransferase-like isoleucine patch superfamily enzyme
MHHVELLSNNGTEATVSSLPWIRLESGAKIVSTKVGGNNTIGQFSCLNRTQIGRYSGVGSFSYIVDTEIGRYTTIGSRVSIGGFNHPTNWLSVHEFQYRDTSQIYGITVCNDKHAIQRHYLPVTKLGNDVWIGDNVVITRGVSVSTGAIVGAGSVVTKDVEPYTIVVGNPARPLRARFEPLVTTKLLELRWWELDPEQLTGLDYSEVTEAVKALETRIQFLRC